MAKRVPMLACPMPEMPGQDQRVCVEVLCRVPEVRVPWGVEGDKTDVAEVGHSSNPSQQIRAAVVKRDGFLRRSKMTKDQIDGLEIGSRVLCHINQVTYEIKEVVNSRTLGPGFDLEDPDGYCRFINKSDGQMDFELVHDQEGG